MFKQSVLFLYIYTLPENCYIKMSMCHSMSQTMPQNLMQPLSSILCIFLQWKGCIIILELNIMTWCQLQHYVQFACNSLTPWAVLPKLALPSWHRSKNQHLEDVLCAILSNSWIIANALCSAFATLLGQDKRLVPAQTAFKIVLWLQS